MRLNGFKKQQIAYYRKKWGDRQFFHSQQTLVTRFFSTVALNKVIKLLPLEFEKKKVLIVCGGGEGLEVKKMRGFKTDLTVSDLSPDALKEVKKSFPGCKTMVADAEDLSFKDNSFQIGLAKDGLHHLKNPEKGIKELLRVCSEAILMIDFQETFLTKFLTKAGLSPEYEEAGNRNFRFSRQRVQRLLKNLKIRDYKIKSYFIHAPFFKSAFFQTRMGFALVKIIFYSFNSLFSRWGNVLMVTARKD